MFGFTQGSFKGNADLDHDQDHKVKNFMQFNSKLDNCWICESWVECEFEIDLVKVMKTKFNQDMRMTENLEVNYHVYIHFDFDEY